MHGCRKKHSNGNNYHKSKKKTSHNSRRKINHHKVWQPFYQPFPKVITIWCQFQQMERKRETYWLTATPTSPRIDTSKQTRNEIGKNESVAEEPKVIETLDAVEHRTIN